MHVPQNHPYMLFGACLQGLGKEMYQLANFFSQGIFFNVLAYDHGGCRGVVGVKGEPPAQRQDRDASTIWALQGDANVFAALVRLIGHRLSEVVFIPLTTPNGRLGSWLIFYCCIVLSNVNW
jgi:hypothetical protein